MDHLHREEIKDNWVPFQYGKSWPDFKEKMLKEGYVQEKHEKLLKYSFIVYECSIDKPCRSKYQVKNYKDYFVVNFNNINHSEKCVEHLLLSKKV
jgi:hypothetical protein